MDIYVLNRYDEFKRFTKLLELKHNVTTKKLMERGFTNFEEPYFHYMRLLNNYPITFNICIRKNPMSIKSISILDKTFLEYYFCDDNNLKQIKNIIRNLNIFKS